MSKKPVPKLCPECNKLQTYFTGKICHNCYRSKTWKRKKKICPRCKRFLHIKAKGLCGGCYTTIFRLQYNKEWNYQKKHNINVELYRKLTKKCIICGFDKIVDLHHLDQNPENNSPDNLVGLCPNHHKMIHRADLRQEVRDLLKEKGFNSKDKKPNQNIKGSY